MKQVAILGGGPAGAFAAEQLARAGIRVRLFDEKLAWEKPCGGGLTFKAYSQYPFLIDNPTPKRFVTETMLSAPRAGEARLKLDEPLLIYSRFDLNHMLLERAERAGAQIEKARVTGMERHGSGWRLRTPSGVSDDADYCIVATGARNPLREVGTQLKPEDTMSALGYYVPAQQERIDIQFLPKLEGYIWIFPRCGHLSIGIGAKGEPAQSLRARLETYMDRQGISRKNAVFYSHALPSLATPSWSQNRVSGQGWLAVGDAGGLVDPITGEGLYYAIRSGDLASQVVLNDAHDIAGKAQAYRDIVAREFTHDLEFAAMLARRVFLGRFLFRSVPQRMVHFMQRSQRFRDLMQDLFAGTQPYLSLRSRLMKNLNGTLQEAFMQFFLERVIPGQSHLSS